MIYLPLVFKRRDSNLLDTVCAVKEFGMEL